MAVAPYPHIEMHVRDDSIYEGYTPSILPLDRPLHMIRAAKGKPGVVTWCPTYSVAVRLFGAETFNKNSKFWSEDSYFLMETLKSNGAFIMRCAEEAAVSASVYLECGVKENADIPQWQRNAITGTFVLNDDGSRVRINKNGDPCEQITEEDADAIKYNETTDTAIVIGKEYWVRTFSEYIYKALKAAVAPRNMVVYKGTGTPVITKVNSTEVFSDPDEVYYSIDTNAGQTIYTVVPDGAELDPSKYYATLKYSEYEAKVVAEGEDISDSVYFERSANIAAGYDYVDLTSVIDAVPGDKIDGGDIFHPVKGTGYVVTTDTEPVEGKTYYLMNDQGEYTPATVDMGFDPDAGLYYEAVETTTLKFIGNAGTVYEKVGKYEIGEYEPQATIPGVKLVWRAVLRNKNDDRPDDSAEVTTSEGFTWYPMACLKANNPGTWGNSFGIRMFFDKSKNSLAGVIQNGAVKYSVSPMELAEDATEPAAIVDTYGEQIVVGTVKEKVIDPSSELDISLKELIPAHYRDSHQLPCKITFIPENFDAVGKIVMKAELKAKEAINALYPELFKDGVTTFVDDLIEDATEGLVDGTEGAGHMANVVSCFASDRKPYFASCVVGTYDEAADAANPVTSCIDMNDDSVAYMKGGDDGDISDAAIERYQRGYIDSMIAGDQEYLVDYLRCPYNSLLDTGVSLKTKKKYLDFMGARDNLTVFLTPQQIWKNADGSEPALLTRYEDESIGASLRSYGLLMREDVENATEANRCIIFLSGGYNSNHTTNKSKLVPMTYWVALKNAKYLNKTYIDKEAVELPNSQIDCFDQGVVWTAASEETRSRVWNAGLNYPQYGDMDVIHFASVRSIYRYDTSVLCDMGTVRAVTFCKDIIRKEWAIWAGSKRFADDLNARITKALNEKLAAMLNRKYHFKVKVYQTDEDKKYGYVRHVDLELEAAGQNRVWIATIICKREGFDASAED